MDEIEEYDQDGEIVTAAPTKATTMPQLQTVPAQTTIVAETTEAEATTFSSTEKTTTLPGDGHDPMEVVEAAVDLLNTPVHRVVGSNPLSTPFLLSTSISYLGRLLRLVGPTKTDFIHGVKLTQEVQKAAGLPTIENRRNLP